MCNMLVLSVFSTDGTDFCNVQVFQVMACLFGGILHFGSQCWLVAHQELPNRSTFVLFHVLWKAVHVCRFPSARVILIFSGAVTFCRIWIVRWWHVQLFRMLLRPVFEVHQEIQQLFDLPGWKQVSAICVLPSPLIEVLPTSYGKLPEFVPDSFGLCCYSFWMSAEDMASWENGISWCCHL